jgi:hypothetical protein
MTIAGQGVRIWRGQGRGLVSVDFASPRNILTSRLISRQVTSSVYVGEKVSDFTQPMRSSAGYVDQYLFNSSRVRCSLAIQLCDLSLGVSLTPSEAAVRQLADKSQFGTLSAATVARVVRRAAKMSVVQNKMPSAETDAMAIVNRRNMTTSQIARSLSLHYKPIKFPARCPDLLRVLWPRLGEGHQPKLRRDTAIAMPAKKPPLGRLLLLTYMVSVFFFADYLLGPWLVVVGGTLYWTLNRFNPWRPV